MSWPDEKSLGGQLNASGVRTRRGDVWDLSTVRTMRSNWFDPQHVRIEWKGTASG